MITLIAALRNSLWAILFLPLVVYVIGREVIGREGVTWNALFGGEEYLAYKASVRRWVAGGGVLEPRLGEVRSVPSRALGRVARGWHASIIAVVSGVTGLAAGCATPSEVAKLSLSEHGVVVRRAPQVRAALHPSARQPCRPPSGRCPLPQSRGPRVRPLAGCGSRPGPP